jgi:hypothetical protein
MSIQASNPSIRSAAERQVSPASSYKDRPGYLPRPRAAEFELVSDVETGLVTWTFKAPQEANEAGLFRPTRLMEKVSRYVEARLLEETPSRTTVEGNVTAKAEYVRQAIDILVTEGYFDETPGSRGARLLTSVRPYREDDE